MHQMWKKLAFQPCDGGLPHEAGRRAGNCQGEAHPSELQEVCRSPYGEAHCSRRQHRGPHGEPDGKNKNKVLP